MADDLMDLAYGARVIQAYLKCSEPIKDVVNDLLLILEDPQISQNDRIMSLLTISDALFPRTPNV